MEVLALVETHGSLVISASCDRGLPYLCQHLGCFLRFPSRTISAQAPESALSSTTVQLQLQLYLPSHTLTSGKVTSASCCDRLEALVDDNRILLTRPSSQRRVS